MFGPLKHVNISHDTKSRRDSSGLCALCCQCLKHGLASLCTSVSITFTDCHPAKCWGFIQKDFAQALDNNVLPKLRIQECDEIELSTPRSILLV